MLHKKTVEPQTLGLLKRLMEIKELEQFRLVGGTALSLLLGHRRSIDLDLFSDQEFDSEVVIEKLRNTFPLFSYKDIKSKRLFFTTINDVKIDFVHTFEPFNNDCTIIDGIRFASMPDLVALKLNAIAGRGAKKDFWDLYELWNHFSFEQMMEYYHDHYPQNSYMMIAKSITYFEEAESDDDPFSFRKVSWKKIKEDIVRKFNLYLKSLE